MEQPDKPELERLESVSGRYDPSSPEEFDHFIKELYVGVLTPWLGGQDLLEMGCATGQLTSLLSNLVSEYHVVEGSKKNIDAARSRVPGATFFHSLWEEFIPSKHYSNILLACGLEHVVDPVDVLRRTRDWLRPDGKLHVIVPNADSLHRYVGMEMGLLEERTSLSESDLRIGHRRVYTIDALLADLRAGGFIPLHWQGILLKLLSNQQMLGWGRQLIQALHRVGQRFPSNCAEVYVVAQRG